MNKVARRLKDTISITYYLMILIFAVMIILIGSLSLISYSEAKDGIIKDNLEHQHQTEQYVIQSLTLIDRGHELFDATLDTSLEDAFQPFLREYERAGRDPGAMDLPGLQEELCQLTGGTVDLYVINSDGIIEYTTLEKDLGLDFKPWPEVYARLTELRQGSRFAADRVVQGFNPTGEYRKYAYMPTPDHRYLLELGLVSDSYHEQRQMFSHTVLVGDLKEPNPDLVSIRLFDITGRMLTTGDDTGYTPDPGVLAAVDEVFGNHQLLQIDNPADETYTRYIFVNLTHGEYVSADMMNLVAELTYSLERQNGEIRSLFLKQLLIALLAVILGLGLAYGTSRYISRPVRTIVEDIDIIARGDLDHRIRSTKGFELERLENAINLLVDKLRADIRTINASRQEIRHYTEHLEEMVLRRTEELTEINREISLYLDLVSYDIQNDLTEIIAYLRMLHASIPDEGREILDRALMKAGASADAIHNITTMRRIYDEELPICTVDLHRVMLRTLHRFPGVPIRYTGQKAPVLADELLSELLANLIGSRIRSGDGTAGITVVLRDRDETVDLTLEDDGAAFPFDLWERAAPGLQRGHGTHRNADELVLLVVRSLADRYAAEVAVESPEKPVRITVRFRKAP
jgi:two-component system sensor histidine kinase BarA